MTEKWKSITGACGYEVSTHGRVRSLPRVNFMGRKYTGRVLLGWRGALGHKYVHIRFDDGEEHKPLVHRLVLEAFVGQAPIGTEGSHLDGKPENNCLDNLVWEDHISNETRKKSHGTLRWGGSHQNSKLNDLQVRVIRRCKGGQKHGISYAELARIFGVHKKTIAKTARGAAWINPIGVAA